MNSLSPSFENNTSDPKSLCFIHSGLQLNWKRVDKASSHPGHGLQQAHTDEGLVIDMQQWHPLIILSWNKTHFFCPVSSLARYRSQTNSADHRWVTNKNVQLQSFWCCFWNISPHLQRCMPPVSWLGSASGLTLSAKNGVLDHFTVS